MGKHHIEDCVEEHPTKSVFQICSELGAEPPPQLPTTGSLPQQVKRQIDAGKRAKMVVPK
jgi:hypothetical protein